MKGLKAYGVIAVRAHANNTITIAILMYTGAIYAAGKGFFLSFFYLHNFVFYEHYTPELGQAWSLAVEEPFYLLWPLIILQYPQGFINSVWG